ncbi:MAG TPA: type II secretion system protein GspC [Candidatus Binataceae bacterium]|nr:type II secretion system protein GspC [Candidatus Binataceae bacterium]
MELRFTEWHVRALNALLIAAIAYFAALSAEDIIARTLHATPAEAPAPFAATHEAMSDRSLAAYDVIVKRDIFNLVPQTAAPSPVVAQDLHIKLLGTSTLSRKKPYAIIEDQTGEQSLYRLGDDIPDAGRLVAIETNRAIIEHNGQRVALEMPKDDFPAVENVPNPADINAPRFGRGFNNRFRRFRRQEPGAESDSAPQESLNLERTGPSSFEVDRQDLMKTVANPASLMTQIRAVPNIQNGTTNGFTLSEITPGSVFEQIGLQDGDVLTGINGQAVNNPLQAVGMLSQMSQRPSVDITVMRDGQPMQFHLGIH